MAKLQGLMIEEGVTIQPYWRTITRHHKPELTGVDMHIAYLPLKAALTFWAAFLYLEFIRKLYATK